MISFVLLSDTIRFENEKKGKEKKNWKLIENVEEQPKSKREREREEMWSISNTSRAKPKSFNILPNLNESHDDGANDGNDVDDGGVFHVLWCDGSEQKQLREPISLAVTRHFYVCACVCVWVWLLRSLAWRKMACGFQLSHFFFNVWKIARRKKWQRALPPESCPEPVHFVCIYVTRIAIKQLMCILNALNAFK